MICSVICTHVLPDKQSSLRVVVVDMLMVYRGTESNLEHLCQLIVWHRRNLSFLFSFKKRFDRSFFGGMIDVKPTELCDTDPEWLWIDLRL